MYASVYRYAKEHDLTPVRYRAMRMPIAYLCIDEEGAYDRLDVVPKADRVKRLCPDIWYKCQHDLQQKRIYLLCSGWR